MNSNLSILLLMVVWMLALIARCDVRHAIGRMSHVTQIQPADSAADPVHSPGPGSAASLHTPGPIQKGGDDGPAPQETPHHSQD